MELSKSTNMQKKWSDSLKLEFAQQLQHGKDGIPSDLVAQYYQQRSGPGIMLTEAAAWDARGQAFPGNGNIYTKQHVQGWKKVIEAVHKKDALIFIQIFHAGRATHQQINGGLQVWGPSTVPCRQNIRVLNNEPYPIPKQMNIQEIKEVQQQFRRSVILAKQAGFDGIQLHGAHGYLVDSFLRSCTNNRTDEYGGNIQKRCKFAIQLIEIALQYFKPWQIGMKVSPVSRLRDMFDEQPLKLYSYLLKQLSKRNIGFLEIRQSTQYTPINKYQITPAQQIQKVCAALRPYFNGILIANDSFQPQSGLKYIQEGSADMISFGRLYVSTPDLAQRIIKGQKPNYNWNSSTFFGYHHRQKGYTDYPFYQQSN